MTDPKPLTEGQLVQTEAFLDGPLGQSGVVDADTARILVAEVRRLRSRVAELEESQRLEWMNSQAVTPHTPRLCVCGHSHHAHRVPSPHSCFAHGKTCPCPAYRQLPHSEAMAQLARNFEAAEGAQR